MDRKYNYSITGVVDRETLAYSLEIDLKSLTYVLYKKKPDSFYVTFDIPKKNGESRTIHAPTDRLLYIQSKLASQLYSIYEEKYIVSKYIGVAQGFVKNRGIITNAEFHKNKKILVNLDLKDFFDSFHFGRVKGFFEKNHDFKLPADVSTMLAQLTCYNGCLPQGAPTSPVITNMICAILDRRLLEIARKYKLAYTRYADDLTFSTNKIQFLSNYDEFLQEISAVTKKSGFTINEKKTRISYWYSRQEVTGLIVNKKIGVKKDFYKTTRAMADYLYRGQTPLCNGSEISIKQLEGRFSFINQIDKYNNCKVKELRKEGASKRPQLSTREKQFRLFLFYKYFWGLERPLIVTEGKTDITYIKAALKRHYKDYPTLIAKDASGHFNYKIDFLKRSKRIEYFLNIYVDGADAMKNIYNQYTGDKQFPNLYSLLAKKNPEKCPSAPVLLIFDNEQKTDRPLKQFLRHIKKPDLLKGKNYSLIQDNLYVLTNPLVNGKAECEIEDLFTDDTLNHEIDGKTFDRHDSNKDKYYGKARFAEYVYNNYRTIDFSEFIPLLDSIVDCSNDYKNSINNRCQ